MSEGGNYLEQPTDSQRKQQAAYRQTSFSEPFAIPRGIPNTGYLLKIYLF